MTRVYHIARRNASAFMLSCAKLLQLYDAIWLISVNADKRRADEMQFGGFLVSLKLEDLGWKVSPTEETVSGRNWRRYGFSIQDFRGLPILSISYKTEYEAKGRS